MAAASSENATPSLPHLDTAVAALSLPLALRSPLTGRLSLAMTAGSAGESQSSAPMRAHGARHCQRILLNGLSLERLFLLP